MQIVAMFDLSTSAWREVGAELEVSFLGPLTLVLRMLCNYGKVLKCNFKFSLLQVPAGALARMRSICPGVKRLYNTSSI